MHALNNDTYQSRLPSHSHILNENCVVQVYYQGDWRVTRHLFIDVPLLFSDRIVRAQTAVLQLDLLHAVGLFAPEFELPKYRHCST